MYVATVYDNYKLRVCRDRDDCESKQDGWMDVTNTNTNTNINANAAVGRYESKWRVSKFVS